MEVPFVCLYDQLSHAFETLQISDMKAVPHEDKENNDNFDVDPLADPRYDKMDLYNLSSVKDRDAIMNASESFASSDSDSVSSAPTSTGNSEAQPASGSGE